MLKQVHFAAGLLSILTIATFFVATVLSEIFGTAATIASVKSLVVMPGLFILVPAIAVTGASGFQLSKSRQGRLITTKKKRMPLDPPLASGRVQSRIQIEVFLVLQGVLAGSATSIKDEVPTPARYCARNRNEVVRAQQTAPEVLLSGAERARMQPEFVGDVLGLHDVDLGPRDCQSRG